MIDDRRKPSVPPPGGEGPVEMVTADVSTVSSRRRAQRKLRVPNDPVPRPGGEGAGASPEVDDEHDEGGEGARLEGAGEEARDTQPDTAHDAAPAPETVAPAEAKTSFSRDPLPPPPRRSIPPPSRSVSVPPPPPPSMASPGADAERGAPAPVAVATPSASVVPPPPAPASAAPSDGEGVVVRQVRRRVRAVGTGTAPVLARRTGEEDVGAPVISVSETSEVEISIPLPSVALIDAAEDDFVVPPEDAGPAIETSEEDADVETAAAPAAPTPAARAAAAAPADEAVETVSIETEEEIAAEDLAHEAKPAGAAEATTPAASAAPAPAAASAEESLTDAEVVEEAAEEIALAEEDLQKPGERKSAPPPPPSATLAKGPPAPPPTAAKRPEPPPVKPKEEKKKRPWWESVFGDDYFHTMAKYTPRQKELEANFIENSLGVERGAVVLDVGCGAGRQAIELSMRGYEVIALDLSLSMLSRAADAAQERGAKLNFVHSDMREMDFSEMFDAAYCMGTSFGFFEEEKNVDVAARLHRALKVGGTFLLEVVNRDYVIQNQPSMAWYEGDGCVCMEESNFNYITSRLEMKRTLLMENGKQREHQYSVRCYSLHELGQMLHQVGFRIIEVSGHQRSPGAFFGPASRSIIILAQKQAKSARQTGEFQAAGATAPAAPAPAPTSPSAVPPPPATPPKPPAAD